MKWILPILCLMFAILRFVQPVSGLNSADILKDMEHIFVGGLFGAAIFGGYLDYKAHIHQEDRDSFWQIGMLAIGLTIVELIAHFVRNP